MRPWSNGEPGALSGARLVHRSMPPAVLGSDAVTLGPITTTIAARTAMRSPLPHSRLRRGPCTSLSLMPVPKRLSTAFIRALSCDAVANIGMWRRLRAWVTQSSMQLAQQVRDPLGRCFGNLGLVF